MRCLVLVLVLVNSGCLSQIIPEHDAATAQMPEVHAMLQTHGFTGSGYVQVNRAPYVSELQPDAWVDMFVSAAGRDAYLAVSPESNAAGPTVPVGTVIVRTASDSAHHLDALTVMVKREAGYFPGGGDFFFGVTDTAGNAEHAPDGTPLWGKLAECGDCHRTRASSGYLFGVAASQR